MTIRVAIADDHPVFLDGLRAVLDPLDEIEVVGEATTGVEAVSLAERERPDVLVMDLHMPDMNGIEATREIVRAHPHTGVLVLTMFEDDDSVFAAMRAGARGYLLKGAGRPDILRAIEAVARGEAIFGSGVARRLLQYFTSGASQPDVFPELTTREHEVLDLMAQGLGNEAIARRLVLSGKTIRNHVSNIFTKLQVASRAEAIVRAREAGLGGERAKEP